MTAYVTEDDLGVLAQRFYEASRDILVMHMTEKLKLVEGLRSALEAIGYGTTLDGATTMPDEGRRVANAGEFAAAWNDRTPAQREDLVVQLLHQQDTTVQCFQQDHAGAVAQLAQRRTEWLVLYWHQDCPECEAHAESAITYAQVSGSVGATYQNTEVVPYDRAGDPTFKPAIAHGARVRRAA